MKRAEARATYTCVSAPIGREIKNTRIIIIMIKTQRWHTIKNKGSDPRILRV